MKKEDLIKIGVNEQVALKCIKAINDEINAEKDKYYIQKQKLIEKIKEYKNQSINEKDGVLKNKITELESLIEREKIEHKKELDKQKIENAVTVAIIKFKGKNIKAISSLLDFSKIKVNNGEVTFVESQIENLAKNEETKFLFELEDKKNNNFRGVSPYFSNMNMLNTKEEFKKMSYKEKNELYKNNLKLYNILKG